jgi:hypothetical protein
MVGDDEENVGVDDGTVSADSLLETFLEAVKERGPVAADEFYELINDVTGEASLVLLDRFVSALSGMSVEELVDAAASR